jgi:hypothetical protein
MKPFIILLINDITQMLIIRNKTILITKIVDHLICLIAAFKQNLKLKISFF